MADVIHFLKTRARQLHRSAAAMEPAAIARVRQLDELRELEEHALARDVKRRHCLAVVAREVGFRGWPDAVAIIGGATRGDFGTLLYPRGADAHWNIWSASYDEARAIREAHGGYLLAYKLHFFIVDRYFIETIGLDPEDGDWSLIGRDWVRPRLPEARQRLYGKLIARRLAA
jgi:hypothetical protein